MMSHPPSTALASVLVFGASAIWGLFWLPLRILEGQGVDGVWTIALINLPATLVLAVVVARQWPHQRLHWRHAAAIGVVAGMGMGLYGAGLIYSSVVRVTMLFYLTPVWATLIGIFWLEERAGWMRWLAIAGGLAGMLLLVSGEGGSVPLGVGDVFAFFSGIFWALGAAMIKRYGEVPVAGMALFQFAAAGVTAVLLGAVAGKIAVPDLTALLQGLPIAAAVSLLALLPSVWAIFWAQKFLFPGRVGLLMMSEVFVATISASLLLPHERMGGVAWSGAALIVLACLAEILLSPSSPKKTAS